MILIGLSSSFDEELLPWSIESMHLQVGLNNVYRQHNIHLDKQYLMNLYNKPHFNWKVQ